MLFNGPWQAEALGQPRTWDYQREQPPLTLPLGLIVSLYFLREPNMETYTVKFWRQKQDGYWEQKWEHVKAKNHDKAAMEICRKYKIHKKKIVSVIQH